MASPEAVSVHRSMNLRSRMTLQASQFRRLLNMALVVLASMLSVARAYAPLTITDSIVVQLKNVPAYKMLTKDDPFHTALLFENSVQLFLSNQLRTMGGNSRFHQLEVYRVEIVHQVLGTPKKAQVSNENGNAMAAYARNYGGRRLELQSHQVRESPQRELESDLRPIHINITATGRFTPTDDFPTISDVDFVDMLLSLFNDRGRELAERLQDLTDVTYFRHVRDVRAFPGDPEILANRIRPNTLAAMEAEVEDAEEEVTFYKDTTAIAAIAVGAVGLLLVAVGVSKVVSLRRRRKAQNQALSGFYPYAYQPNLQESLPSYHPYGPKPAHMSYEYTRMNGFKENLSSPKHGHESPLAALGDASTIDTDDVSGRGKRRSGGKKSKDKTLPSDESYSIAKELSDMERKEQSSKRPRDSRRKHGKRYKKVGTDTVDEADEENWSAVSDSVVSEQQTANSRETRTLYDDSTRISSSSSKKSEGRRTIYDDDTRMSSSSTKKSEGSRTVDDDATRFSSSSTNNSEGSKTRYDDSTRASSSTSSKSKTRSTRAEFMHLNAESYDGVKRECHAPTGKLGVAIDTGPGGIGPIVYKLKPGSPLEGILKPGDRIVAIDEVDTRFMSAANVTKMMVRRMDSKRKITYMTVGV